MVSTFAPFREDDTLMAFIGQVEMATGDGDITLRVRLHEHAANPLGILHGGALSALFDVAMYEAARQTGEAVTTAQETKFFKPVSTAAILKVTARVLRTGKRAVFCKANALQNGTLCGFSTAQFTRI